MAIRLDEVTRQQLLNKSKNADVVKSYGTTRFGRRNNVRLYNTTQNYNRIDMNSCFKADILSFMLPVQGETDNYEVQILFEGLMGDIKQEIKTNNNILEYKVVYRALIKAINRQDLLIGCTCPDFKYRFQYWATHNRYNAGHIQLVPAKITNPNDSKGAGCKHTMKVLADLDWALKLATVINNYIEYIRLHYPDKFQRLIFPVLYDMSWEEANELWLFDTEDELANTVDNDDTTEIDLANSEGIQDSDIDYNMAYSRASDEPEEGEE